MLAFIEAEWTCWNFTQVSANRHSRDVEPHQSPTPILLDVRTPTEFNQGQIFGAVNIPVDGLRDRFSELPTNQEMVVYCQVGQRGYLATRVLLQSGYQEVNLSGGYKTYLLHQS
jgi:rhodanese-related sulfurtransferase